MYFQLEFSNDSFYDLVSYLIQSESSQLLTYLLAGPDGSGGLVDAEGNPIVAAGADGVEGAAPTEGNVIYIDPNDPQVS